MLRGIFGDQLAALKHRCHHWVVRGGVNLLAIGDFSVMRARDLQGAPRSGRLRFAVRPCSARCSGRALLGEQCLGTLLRRALLIGERCLGEQCLGTLLRRAVPRRAMLRRTSLALLRRALLRRALLRTFRPCFRLDVWSRGHRKRASDLRRARARTHARTHAHAHTHTHTHTHAPVVTKMFVRRSALSWARLYGDRFSAAVRPM